MTTITEDQEIILGLCCCITVGVRPGIDSNLSKEHIYLFYPMGYHHLVCEEMFLCGFIDHLKNKTEPENPTLKALYYWVKDELYTGQLHNKFKRGYVTNKRLFVNNSDAYPIAVKSGQLHDTITVVFHAVLHSSMLSLSKSERIPGFNESLKQLHNLDYNCTILDNYSKLKCALASYSSSIPDYSQDKDYMSYLNKLVQGMSSK
jgi:hypothetical protein